MKKIIVLMAMVIVTISINSNSYAYEGSVSSTESSTAIDEYSLKGMIIGYTDEGVPIVDDFNKTVNPLMRTVYAKVSSPYGYLYSSKTLSESTLLFSIPRGKKVIVVDSNVSSSVAKVKYAGYTGYIRKSNLAF